MYTETMTSKEIIKRYKDDISKLCRKACRIFDGVRKEVLARDVFPFRYVTYVRYEKTNDEYIMVINAYSRKETKAKLERLTYYPIIRSREGINVIEVSQYEGLVILYTSHFFDRYKQRMGDSVEGLSEKDKIGVIKTFLTRNEHAMTSLIKDKNGNTELEFACNDGSIMIRIASEDRWTAKTFVRKDMLFDGQQVCREVNNLEHTRQYMTSEEGRFNAMMNTLGYDRRYINAMR